ncbi:hypothetical protein [Haloprofundus halobius]|uniref:hypothetical protein n=1 Tax=Haloprofundus halobius TaxID=2876194 RepID=UPI001CCE26DE|nr:hypothetical protein [Haloprofundus halobius]
MTRKTDNIVIEEARGPTDQFEPVTKKFAIESQELGSTSLSFEHSVSRRVWQEDERQPAVRSQRSQGRVFEILYRASDGWHLDQPEPSIDDALPDTEGTIVPTRHTGISVKATFVRSEVGTDLKFTEEREYYITNDIFDDYETIYVLSYNEVNEESTENLVWTVDNATAYKLIQTSAK